MASTDPVTGEISGVNDESVLLDASAAMAQRIEGKVRAGLQVEHFVSHQPSSDGHLSLSLVKDSHTDEGTGHCRYIRKLRIKLFSHYCIARLRKETSTGAAQDG